jgi:ParB-like chromosome segregation protein Spo0J
MATSRPKKRAPRKARDVRAVETEYPRNAHTIEQWPIDRLKAYARNSRTHSPEQLAALSKSIERFGFTNPVLAAPDGTIIAGHGRVQAALRLGMKIVPVIVADGWTDDERRAYVITDNQLALEAGWDEDLLKLELRELEAAEFDLGLTGFDAKALDKLLDRAPADPKDSGPQLSGLKYSIVVRCDGEVHQMELLERFEKEGLKCEALIS